MPSAYILAALSGRREDYALALAVVNRQLTRLNFSRALQVELVRARVYLTVLPLAVVAQHPLVVAQVRQYLRPSLVVEVIAPLIAPSQQECDFELLALTSLLLNVVEEVTSAAGVSAALASGERMLLHGALSSHELHLLAEVHSYLRLMGDRRLRLALVEHVTQLATTVVNYLASLSVERQMAVDALCISMGVTNYVLPFHPY